MEVLSRLRQYGKKDFYGLLGFIFFGFFLILSVVLFKECIIHQDYAWELTWILNGKGLTPVYFRWGAIPWRIFFILGPSIGLSLKSVLILSSVWFIFSYFLVWLVCHFYFKNQWAGLLVIFSIIISNSKGFYTQGLQVYNAVVYFCLLYAVVTDDLNANRLAGKPRLLSLLVIAFSILIKETYVALFLSSIPLLIYFATHKWSWQKGITVCLVGTYALATAVLVRNPYEQQIFSSLKDTIFNKGWNDIDGIMEFFLLETINLNYLTPLILLLLGLYALIKQKMVWTAILSSAYMVALFVIVVIKLSTYDSDYPLSSDADYYIQAATYTLLLTILSFALYWLSVFKVKILNNQILKTILVLTTVFYTSQIAEVGIRHLQYNRYLKSLMGQLSSDFSESLFVINHRSIPARFSKLNINIEFETLVKSNLWFERSMILLVTPHDTLFHSDSLGDFYVNSLPQFEKSDEIDLDLNERQYHFKLIKPKTTFANYNSDYFNFDNHGHRIVPKAYIRRFNKDYGFEISEQ